MGHTEGERSLPFGHSAKAADDIDGLIVSRDAQNLYLFTEYAAILAPRGPPEISPCRRFGGRH